MREFRPALGLLAVVFCLIVFPLAAQAAEVRLEDFGAVVNDGQDDSAAVQAAANAVFQNGGGTILFPSGKIEIRNTVRFVPEGYVGGDLKLKGNRGSVVEISAGVNGTPFYGGNLTTWTFEDLTMVGKNVQPGDPAFYDAAWVVFSNNVQQTNIIRCQFYGLAVPNDRAVVYFGNTDGKITDSQFDGSLGQYPNGAVVTAENSRGLSVTRTTFLDYANFMGVYYSKSTAYTGAWIQVKGGMAHNANGQRRTLIQDSRFDEGAAAAIRIEDVAWASIKGINVNVSGTTPGTGVYLKNVEHAVIEQSWFGYTTEPRLAITTVNVGGLEVSSLKFGGGVYFKTKPGKGSVSVRNCAECEVPGSKK